MISWTEQNGQGTTSSAPAVAPAQLRQGAWTAMADGDGQLQQKPGVV